MSTMPEDLELQKKLDAYNERLEEARTQISKAVVGQKAVINSIFRAIIANGHLLVEGIPGIAKTLIVRTVSTVFGCDFKRIQFTPDLLPTDIVGLTTYEPSRGFYIIKGPVFSNFILADEINRAPPKVQSALLEAMQERQVTIGKETFELPAPFFVFATQNPVEQLGTYPLPEAQLDRFLFKLLMGYPSIKEEERVLTTNMTTQKFKEFTLDPILDEESIVTMQQDVKEIYLDPKIEKYIVRIVDATRFPAKYHLNHAKYIDWGVSPRASIGLYISAKAEAFLNRRTHVTPFDVKVVAHDVLRHRIILNYEAQSLGITTDQVIDELLGKVPID